MNILKILIVLFVFHLQLCGEDKKEDAVDKTLDPFYFHRNWQDIQGKRKPQFRLRKGNVPEQIWRINTNGIVSVTPFVIDSHLLIGTLNGFVNYVNLKTGAVDPKSFSAGNILTWMSTRNDNSIIAMTLVGNVVNFFKGWESAGKTAYGANKNDQSSPIGAISWGAGCVVARRDNFPIMLELKDCKVVSEYKTKLWVYGQATAPLMCNDSAFWLATSKGDLISFNLTLSVINSTIKLQKSFATALAFEGNIIYVLTADKELLAYDSSTNILKWKTTLEGKGIDSIVCEKGKLYVNAGSFYVVNCEDGKILLEQKTRAFEKFMRTKPVITNKRIYSCDSEGNIYIINKNDYKVLQVINLEEDVMVGFLYQDDVLYIPTIAGFLYAIDVSAY